jgi:4-diphosphocytidyl-2-C-methyl-D-erythritol kinase
MLTIKAPAKINWFLEILGKRPDGYHEIATVMQTIDLFDEIRVEDDVSGEITLTCNIDLGDPRQNLVYRAAELLRDLHAPTMGARIHLTKRIPHGAGLGGGSSDAANALIALNRQWGLDLCNGVLQNLVSRVGSDCAFFIEGGTAICTGRGEIVEQIPDIVGVDLVVLYPEDVCPTPKVYAQLAGHLTYEPRDCYLFHDLTNIAGVSDLIGLVFNRLQEPALRVSARLRKVWDVTTQEVDVLVRFVSGSGSSIAFLMPSREAAVGLAESLTQRQLGRAFAVKTLPRGAVWG